MKPSIDDVVLRYFVAFGPASVADVAAWSGLTGMREVVERLRPQLRPFHDGNAHELFDLPAAPRPETPAPPRFLPEYDNVFLGYADRSRFMSEERRLQLYTARRPVRGSVLHDGVGKGTWWLDPSGDRVTLEVNFVGRLTKKATSAIGREGRRLLGLLAPERAHDVRFAALD